jgi:hypothetical protein
MKKIVRKTTVTAQPSAGTSFNLMAVPGQPVFSWENPTINKEKDDFFKIKGKVEDQPRSTILFKID